MDSYGAFKIDTFDGEDRYVDRHDLSLDAAASTPVGAAPVQILNLSSGGLLVKTSGDFAVGETIEVELPLVGMQQAQVVWRGDGFYGCEFLVPVSTAAVSAARLRSPPPGEATAFVEQPEVPVFIAPRIAEPRGLTLGQKAATIVGLALASWGVVIGGVWLVV